MDNHFQKVKEYLIELNYAIQLENEDDGILIVENQSEGINNVVLIISDPILIVEQFLFELKANNNEVYKQLLMKNRDIIHGAFALDDTGSRVLFRNTHECENLDLNELEATLNSLALLLSEYANEIISFSK